MNAIHHFLAGLSWNHLVLALLHSLWQGAAVAGLLALLLAALPARRARLRYGLALSALLMVVAGVAVTWAYLDYEGNSPKVAVGAVAAVQGNPGAGNPAAANPGAGNPGAAEVGSGNAAVNTKDAKPQAAEARPSESPRNPGRWLAWAGWVWIAGCAVMLLRVIVMVAHSRRQIEKTSARLNVPDHVHNMVARLCGEMGVRQAVRVLVSAQTRNPGAPGSPGVIGALWPTLLLPLAVVNDLPATQLRMILAHELAHIRRWDYLVNLGQLVIEALLYFNPAVWWLSRQVRLEREACCDALAVAVTGDRAGYVAALADAAERMTGGAPGARGVPGLAMAFGTHHQSSLLVRAYRILGPRKRPPVALPWYSLAGLGMLGFFLLISLRGGAVAIVAAAAQILTPEQRIKELEQLEQTHGQGNRDMGSSDTPAMEIAGTIRTEDGSPLPPLRVTARSESPGYTQAADLGRAGDKFTGKLKRGTIAVTAVADGYAPALFGPAPPDDPQLQKIALVLARGFEATIHLLDDQGKMVPKPKVSASWEHGHAWAPAALWIDPSGPIIVEHSLQRPLRLTVETPGYQYDEVVVNVDAKKPAEVKIVTARPTTGVVVAADSGQPVADATIHLCERTGFSSTSSDPTWPGLPELARTDSTGRFTLSTLRDDCTYALVVRATDRAPLIVEHVRAGEKDLKWPLKAPLIIRGRIDGDLSKLMTQGRTPQIPYGTTVELGGHNGFSSGGQADVVIRDGHGYFEIPNLLPGTVKIQIGSVRRTVDTEAIPEELVFDLDAKPAQLPTRKVILTFDVPAGSPPPRGTLRVDYIKPENPQSYWPEELPIKDGQVTLEVPVPTKLHYDTAQTIGYWIKDQSEIPVPAAEEPFVLKIPAVPAGAIFGMVTGPDGKPTANYNVNLVTVERSPEQQGGWINGNSRRPDADGKFLLTPLPLGGKYLVVVGSNEVGNEAKAIAAAPMLLDKAHPMQEVRLQLPEGVTVEGKIVDPQDRPVSGVKLRLNWESKAYSYSHSGAEKSSDRQGQFRFEHVNPGLQEYQLRVQPAADYQGTNVPIKPGGGPVTVKLEPGVKLRGQVIDSVTGWPIPHARVSARPTDYSKMKTDLPLEVLADAHGEFVFSTLEPQEYRLQVDDAVSVGTIVTHNANGSTTYTTPAGVDRATKVTGGQAAPVTLRVQIIDPKLKAVKPEP